MREIGKGIATIAIWGAVAFVSTTNHGDALVLLAMPALIATMVVWGS